MKIVPANQRRDLPDLVGLGLTLLRLEVDELGNTRSSGVRIGAATWLVRATHP